MSWSSRGPCCAQNEIKPAKAFTSVSVLKRPLLCPERDKILLGAHKCLGPQEAHVVPRMKRKPFEALHKCLGPQEAHVAPRRKLKPLRLSQVPRSPRSPCCAQNKVKTLQGVSQVSRSLRSLCCAQNEVKTPNAYINVSVPKMPMSRPK